MTNVHFVGSIGLDTVDEVFFTAGKLLGSHRSALQPNVAWPERGRRRPSWN